MNALNAYFAKQRGAKAGLAKALGLSRAAVCLWRDIPAKHVLDIERITGISRHVLRPDIFGGEP